MSTCSGGEQKRLALEAVLRGDAAVLLLDEPDNFLDVPGKRWLEAELRRCPKTILFVSHDRELLAAVATKIVTVEASGAWTHGGGFTTYHDARQARNERLARDAALWEDERERLVELVREMRRRAKISDTFAPRLKAAETRLRHFDERTKPPELVREQRVDVRLTGGRTGRKALMVERLALHGLTDAFDAEIWYGERVAVLGPNGAGKSHFLRLVAGDASVAHDGEVRLGARVVPGHFSQTHEHPEWHGRTLLELLEAHDVVRGPAMGMLRRYELQRAAEQRFESLSGGQQARFQILLLELEGATLLLLDEPTDNLDLESAEALEDGLGAFEGTVVAVTHDRWFLRSFDRFLVFNEDCSVKDLLEPPGPLPLTRWPARPWPAAARARTSAREHPTRHRRDRRIERRGRRAALGGGRGRHPRRRARRAHGLGVPRPAPRPRSRGLRSRRTARPTPSRRRASTWPGRSAPTTAPSPCRRCTTSRPARSSRPPPLPICSSWVPAASAGSAASSWGRSACAA